MPLPVVRLDELPPNGMTVKVGVWAQAAVVESFGEAEVRGTLRVLRHGPHIIVTGDLALNARVSCDRCLTLIPLSLAPTFSVLYTPVGALADRAEGDDADGPALPQGLPVQVEDAGEYDGVALNLSDVVSECLELERPFRYDCAEANPADPSAEAACVGRWTAAAKPDDIATANPFSSLAGWKPPTR